MNLEVLVRDLERLSLFELGCIGRHISTLIDDPHRVASARTQFRPGMEVHYWDTRANGFVKAVVVELLRTTAHVENVEDKQRWTIHLSNIAPPESTPVQPSVPSVPKTAWRVGDLATFRDRQNREHVGTIEKLNPRRAQIRLKTGEAWRVHYELLIPIHELEASKPKVQTLAELEREARETSSHGGQARNSASDSTH